MHNHTERVGMLSGAIFLLGLSFLFYTGAFWPFILPLIWLTSVPTIVAENGIWRGLFGLVPTVGVIMLGIPFLIVTGTIWPFILPLIWIASVPVLITENGWRGLWSSLQTGLWLCGLSAIFWMNFPFVSGMLILAGLSALLIALAPKPILGSAQRADRDRPSRRHPAAESYPKRKNTVHDGKRKNDDNLPLAPRARRLSDLEPNWDGDTYHDSDNNGDNAGNNNDYRVADHFGEGVPVPDRGRFTR